MTAYKGAAPLITDKDVLEAAAGLLAVEAYHAGEIRTAARTAWACSARRARSPTPGTPGRGRRQGPGHRRSGKANIVPTDANGLAFSRSTGEVLNIVYLGGAGSGGFFPNGVNGLIA